MSINFWHDKELIVGLGPTTSSTATSTSAVVDAANCEGVAWIMGVGDLGAASAFTVVTGSSAACAGSTAVSVSVSTGDHVALVDNHKPVVRYSKAVMNPGAAANDGTFALAIRYGVRKGPVSQGSTSVTGTTVIVGQSS